MELQKELHDDLYYQKEVKVVHPQVANGSEIELSIMLHDFANVPDCQVGHFGYNFWYRTPLAVKGKAYSSAKKMESAVERILTRRGFSIVGWVKSIV